MENVVTIHRRRVKQKYKHIDREEHIETKIANGF